MNLHSKIYLHAYACCSPFEMGKRLEPGQWRNARLVARTALNCLATNAPVYTTSSSQPAHTHVNMVGPCTAREQPYPLRFLSRSLLSLPEYAWAGPFLPLLQIRERPWPAPTPAKANRGGGPPRAMSFHPRERKPWQGAPCSRRSYEEGGDDGAGEL